MEFFEEHPVGKQDKGDSKMGENPYNYFQVKTKKRARRPFEIKIGLSYSEQTLSIFESSPFLEISFTLKSVQRLLSGELPLQSPVKNTVQV